MAGFTTKPIVWSELENEIARVLSIDKDLNTAALNAPLANEDTEVALIDWQSALTRWPDKDSLADNIQHFLNYDWRREWTSIYDVGGLSAFAHRLRGGALNLGLTALAEFAADYEKTEQMPDLIEAMARLTRILTQTSADLYQARAQQEHAAGSAIAPRDEKFYQLLDQLEQIFSRNGYDEMSLQYLLPYLESIIQRRLLDALNKFDFATAIEILRTLRN